MFPKSFSNFTFYQKKKDILINDSVILIRSGDVIPKIIKSLPTLRDGTQKQCKIPTHCPICKSELLIEEKLIKCQNLNCRRCYS